MFIQYELNFIAIPSLYIIQLLCKYIHLEQEIPVTGLQKKSPPKFR